jgi:hypothetical protein
MSINYPAGYANLSDYAIVGNTDIIVRAGSFVDGSIALTTGMEVTVELGTSVTGSTDIANPAAETARVALELLVANTQLYVGGDGVGTLISAIAGQTLVPGVYYSDSLPITVSGTITLTGNPGDQYIFVAGGNIEFDSDTVIVPGNINPWDIFWSSGRSITDSGGSQIYGILVADENIILNNTTLDGAAFSNLGVVTTGNDSTINRPSNLPCYLKGTLILGEDGYVPIETIKVGDKVQTFADIKTSIDVVKHESKLQTCIFTGSTKVRNPIIEEGVICFLPGSLGENLPSTTLYLSPKHGVLVDHYLVPAKHMINGTTIFQDLSQKDIEYFYIELDSHACIKAHDVLAESFNRG